eukprot:COSAG01_NODE_46313_length_401_cov_0.761589_1_plen_48_part_10
MLIPLVHRFYANTPAPIGPSPSPRAESVVQMGKVTAQQLLQAKLECAS